MNKKLLTVYAVVGLIVATFSAGSNSIGQVDMDPPPGLPSEVWVDDDFTTGTAGWGVTHFDNIQDAVDAVASGGVVNVAAGTYSADPVMGKGVYIIKDGVALIGESATTTIIDGNVGGVGGSGSYWPKGIHIQANDVIVENFTVRAFTGDLSSTGGYGVLFRDYDHDQLVEGYIFYDNCTVRNVIVRDCYSSIYALCFTHLSVLNCAVRDSLADGMFIARGSDDAIVEGNVVSNSGDHGIWVGYSWAAVTPSDRATIRNNDVNGAREGGISFVASDTATIAGNIITNVAGSGWSVGALSLKDGPSNVEAYNNTIYNNDGSWGGYGGTGHGVGIDGAASNINLHDNNIYGNTGHGCYNYSAAVVTAENNWWGHATGPLDAGGIDETDGLTCYDPATMKNADGSGDQVSDNNVDYCPWLDQLTPANANLLALNVQAGSLYVKVGQAVVVDMDVMNLAQKVNGCQALLGYSSTYLLAAGGSVVPGGGVWDELIYNSWDVGSGVPGEIDTAIGLDAWGHIGTKDDGTVAIISLTAVTEGTTNMIFRADGEDGYATMLADMNAQPIWPAKLDSQGIVIDSTNPSIDITSAKQGTTELLDSPNAVQGDVIITVGASDALAGLDGIPAVVVTPSGGPAVEISGTGVDNGNGTFSYTYTVSAATPNGTAIINTSVSDKSGNSANDSDTFNINKDQVTGDVELELLNPPAGGIDRTVTFVATGGGDNKTWDIAVNFTAGSTTSSYKLTDVPAGTSDLSAKTAWHLRERIAVTDTGNGQLTAQFTGSNKLRGGDINGDNMVQILDYSLLKIDWFTHNPVADIDGDGDVSMPDYSIMKGNWFQAGSPPSAEEPSPPPAPCPSYPTGDFDRNCRVDWADFAVFATLWQDGPCGEPHWCGGADLDKSGLVDWGDFAVFAANWGKCTAPECN